MSVGAGPARYSVHSSGRRTVSARTGIPGVYYQQSVSGRGRKPTAAASASADRARKPGLFAPKAEKELYKAVGSEETDDDADEPTSSRPRPGFVEHRLGSHPWDEVEYEPVYERIALGCAENNYLSSSPSQ
jgi:hypothetical protein